MNKGTSVLCQAAANNSAADKLEKSEKTDKEGKEESNESNGELSGWMKTQSHNVTDEVKNPKKEETTIDSKSECQQDVGSCTKKEKSNECSQPITIPSREIPSERTTLRAPEKTDEVQTAPLNNSSRRKAPPTINAKNIHIPKLALQNIQRQVSDL